MVGTAGSTRVTRQGRYGYTQPQKLAKKSNAQTPFGGHGPAPQLKNPFGLSPHACVSPTQRQFVTGGTPWSQPSQMKNGTQRSPGGQSPPQPGYCDGPHADGLVVDVEDVVVVVVVG
jgi:hypothetical protein